MKYRVVKPCIFKSGGKVVHQLKTGVQVDADDAKRLVDSGHLKEVAEPKPEPKAEVKKSE